MHLKEIFKVWREDLKAIVTNKPTLIIIIGLCIIPSLYAWVNIKACWDPYANTGNMPVAVVNKDEGATINDKTINVGNEVIESLKKNDSIDWIFLDEWQANYGLNEGKYYSLIEIPANFSKGLVSLTTTTPQKPNIIYKNNEKANAIATKITSAVKGKVTDEIKTNFVTTVNEKAFETLNELGVKVEDNKPKILEIKDVITSTNNNLQSVKDHIATANKNTKSFETYLYQVKNDLPLITNQIDSLQQVTNASKGLITSTQQDLSTLSNNLSNDVIELQSINNNIQSSLNKLRDKNNEFSPENANKVLDDMDTMVDILKSITDRNIENLEAINGALGSPILDDITDIFRNIQSSLVDQKNRIEDVRTAINKGETKENINMAIDALTEANTKVSNSIGNLSNRFFDSGLNVLNSLGDQVSGGMNIIDSVLNGVRGVVPRLTALTNFGISTSKLASDQADKLTDKLGDFQEKVDKLSDKTKDLNDKNIDDMVDLMSKNPETMGSFISSPIEVEATELYGVGTFGVGLTPFYTTLAIWVGALLLSSMLTVECEPIEGSNKKLSFMMGHFAKMLTFLTVSAIQTIIIVLGDVFILGVKPANFPLMMAFGLLSSLTFVMIIYTLASVLGNVGKAVAVVIMVMQIAGSGGLYPIQTNPKIFGMLQPLWPFTYAIDGFRQAIAGPIGSHVKKDVLFLFLIIFIFLVIGFLKKPLHKLSHGMEHKFEESGL